MTYYQDFRINVAFDDGSDEANILFLGDSTSIIDLSAEHVKHFVGYIVVRFDKLLQLSPRDD